MSPSQTIQNQNYIKLFSDRIDFPIHKKCTQLSDCDREVGPGNDITADLSAFWLQNQKTGWQLP